MTSQPLRLAARPVRDPARTADHTASPGGRRFDWTIVLLSIWFVGGLYLDGWAHTHGKVDQSFFTPWHAFLYSGQLVVMLFLEAQLLRNHLRGFAWRQALPAGYGLSLVGVLLWIPGGVGDLIWHSLFGIEKNVEALFSPTHLILALGLALAVSGPWRAALARPDGQMKGLKAQLPMLVSVGFVLSVLTFFLQIAYPISNLWSANATGGGNQEQGLISIILDTALLMGTILLIMRRWTLAPGALTLIVTLNAVLMGFLFDQGAYPLAAVVARAAAGVVADGLLLVLRPSADRTRAWRWFALAVPMVVCAFYFAAIQLTSGIGWTIHLWVGSIVVAGVTGLLVSFLSVPPAAPATAASSAS